MVQRPFRFSLQFTARDDPQSVREQARKAEDLGYDELFSSDHITGGGLSNSDPFLPLLVAAEATTTLRFGPLVLNNEFWNPALLARTAASFDRLTGGRLVLGMGTGYDQSEHDAIDVPLRKPGDRVTRFAESIDALRSLLNEGQAHCSGQHIKLAIDDLGARPAQTHVPILIGGHGRRVVSIAARAADIFQYTGLVHDRKTGKPSAGGFARSAVVDRYRWLQEHAGERLASIEISTLVQQTHVGPKAEQLRDEAAARMKLRPETIDGSPFGLFGSVQQVVDKLHGLRDELGISHVVVRDPDDMAPVVAALSGY